MHWAWRKPFGQTVELLKKSERKCETLTSSYDTVGKWKKNKELVYHKLQKMYFIKLPFQTRNIYYYWYLAFFFCERKNLPQLPSSSSPMWKPPLHPSEKRNKSIHALIPDIFQGNKYAMVIDLVWMKRWHANSHALFQIVYLAWHRYKKQNTVQLIHSDLPGVLQQYLKLGAFFSVSKFYLLLVL